MREAEWVESEVGGERSVLKTVDISALTAPRTAVMAYCNSWRVERGREMGEGERVERGMERGCAGGERGRGRGGGEGGG